MGLNTPQNMTFIRLKDKDKNLKYAFYLSDDKSLENPYSSFTGVLSNVIRAEKEFEGKKFTTYQFIFKDGEESFSLELSENQDFSRSLLNCLASLDDFSKRITIRPSAKERISKTTSKPYKSYYMNVSIGDELVKSKYSYTEDIPKVEWVKVGTKNVANDSDLLAFFVDVYNEIKERLNSNKGTSSVEQEPNTVNSTPTTDKEVYRRPSSSLAPNKETQHSYKSVPNEKRSTVPVAEAELPEIGEDDDDELPF